MPGLVGEVRLGAPSPARVRRGLERLAGPADRTAVDELGCAVFGYAGLPFERGGIARSHGVLCVVHGWIAASPLPKAPALAEPAAPEPADSVGRGTGGEKEPPPDPPIEPASAGARCLAAYLEGGLEVLSQLNGVYAAAIWDDRRGRLVLGQDRLGMAGVYYRADRAGVRFASRARALVEPGSAELDARAVGDLMTVGYPLGDRTLFRGVRALDSGCVLIWERDGWSVRRVWTLPPRDDQAEPEAALEAMSAALDEAVGEQLSALPAVERVVLPLSGGLDSRTIGGYARRHRGLATLSYGHHHARDLRFGTAVARRLGSDHRRVRLRPDFMARYGPRLVFLTDGEASMHAAHLLCLQPELARRPALVLSGFLGDVLTGSHLGWLGAEPQRETGSVEAMGRALFDRIYQSGASDDELAALLRPEVARETEGATFEAFMGVYRAGNDPVARADRVDLLLRQRRFVSYQLDVVGAAAAVRSPFADERVLDVGLRWPNRFRYRQELYRGLLAREHPDLARVPVTASGIPVRGPWLRLALGRWFEHARAVGIPRFTRGLVRFHDYRQYAHYGAWIRGGSRHFFSALLGDAPRVGEVFEVDRVMALFDAHIERRVDAYRQLCAIATVVLWLRFFAQSDPTPGVDTDADAVSNVDRSGVAP